jgi:hypothetical protein
LALAPRLETRASNKTVFLTTDKRRYMVSKELLVGCGMLLFWRIVGQVVSHHLHQPVRLDCGGVKTSR